MGSLIAAVLGWTVGIFIAYMATGEVDLARSMFGLVFFCGILILADLVIAYAYKRR